MEKQDLRNQESEKEEEVQELIIEDGTIYEIDLECIKRRKRKESLQIKSQEENKEF